LKSRVEEHEVPIKETNGKDYVKTIFDVEENKGYEYRKPK
jgi:hypothetical protein